MVFGCVCFCLVCNRCCCCDKPCSCSFCTISLFALAPIPVISFVALGVLATSPCNLIQRCFTGWHGLLNLLLFFLHYAYKHCIVVNYLLDVFLLFFSLLAFFSIASRYMFHSCVVTLLMLSWVCPFALLYLLWVMYASSKKCWQFFHVFVFLLDSSHLSSFPQKTNQVHTSEWPHVW